MAKKAEADSGGLARSLSPSLLILVTLGTTLGAGIHVVIGEVIGAAGRIEGSKCFVETYQFRTTETSRNPYLPAATNTTFITFSTPKTHCSFLLW